MSAGKILNTSNALYANIVRALSGDEKLPKMVALKSGDDTILQPWHYCNSMEVPSTTWTAIQGIVRTDTHWYAIDTSEIRKYDLSDSLVATNAAPFAGLLATVDHCGSGFVDGSFLYVAVVNWDGTTQTATDQCIAKYNISDLTLDSFFDTTAQSACNGSGVCISPDGTEIYMTSFFNGAGADVRKTDIYRFSKSDGSFLGILQLQTPVIGIQSLVQHDGDWFVGSYDSTINLICRFDTDFNLITKIDPILSTPEMEGLTSHDGVLYFNHVNGTPRILDLSNMTIGRSLTKGAPAKFLSSTDMPETATLLVRATMYSMLNFQTFFDNKTDANNWEAWNETDFDFHYRVDSTQRVTVTPLNPQQEYLFAFTWEKIGANVTIKLGIDGVYVGTNALGTWVPIPADGLWLAGGNASNNQGDNRYNDTVLLDKVLSDAELLSAYNDFDDFYSDEGVGNTPPVAEAGVAQSVAAGASVTLDGSGSSDSDGSIVSYLWSQTGGDAVTLSSTSVISPTFTAPSTGANQDLTFQLLVTDDGGATDTDTVVITVASIPTVSITFTGTVNNRTTAVNSSPSINVSGNFIGTETPFTYSLQSGSLPTGMSLNTSTGIINGTPTVVESQSGIVVRATDGASNTADTNSFSINVVDGVVIPVEDRSSAQAVAKFLNTQGMTGNINEVILGWLNGEGYYGNSNEAWVKYLYSLGYSGNLSDMHYLWSKGF